MTSNDPLSVPIADRLLVMILFSRYCFSFEIGHYVVLNNYFSKGVAVVEFQSEIQTRIPSLFVAEASKESNGEHYCRYFYLDGSIRYNFVYIAIMNTRI